VSFKEKIVVIDPQTAGIAGDMFLGALVDLGADKKIIEENLSKIPNYIKNCRSLDLEVKEVVRQGLRGTKVTVKVKENYNHRKGRELKEAVEKFLIESNLSNRAKNFVQESFLTLLRAEAKLHSSTVEEVHLHETGSADTLADIIGVATALESLGFFKENIEVCSLPVCVGKGKVKTSHGNLSVPTPATLEILVTKNFPFEGTNVEEELSTPTGVSLLTNIAKPVEIYPLMHGLKVGYGAGQKDFSFTPNLLRITVGVPSTDFQLEEIYIVETNVDDVTGEVIGYLVEKLNREGVKDVYVVPSVGKKSRPVLTVRVMVEKEEVKNIAALVFNETGSLGVRIYPCKRFILQREIVPVEVEFKNKIFKVNVKIAKDKTGKIVQIKPEFEDLKKIAEETGIPLRKVAKKTEEKTKILTE